eukprot:scaffold5540_cov96-Cylindrotheca_fusiformis.AAC.12
MGLEMDLVHQSFLLCCHYSRSFVGMTFVAVLLRSWNWTIRKDPRRSCTILRCTASGKVWRDSTVAFSSHKSTAIDANKGGWAVVEAAG